MTEKNEDLIGVTAHSIKNSGLFFSVPLIKDCDKSDGTYDGEVLKKIFKNCLINAYYSQALLNLKEFYRQEAKLEKNPDDYRQKEDEERKGVKNTKTTQPSQQEQNGNQTTQEGENGIDPLRGVDNCQTNKKIGGIDALQKIKEARDQEKDKMKPKLDSIPTIRQNTRTSGQGNVLY